MGFEVRPTPVGSPRSRRSIVAVLIAGVAIVGLALATKPPAASPSSRPQQVVADAQPTSSQIAAAAASSFVDAPATVLQQALAAGQSPGSSPSAATPEPAIHSLPDKIECKGVDYDSCLLIAVAAIRALPEPTPVIRSAAIWKSLMCDNSLDCPPGFLRTVVPLGSVVLTFDAGTTWMNVVGRPVAGGFGPSDLRLEAWIVR